MATPKRISKIWRMSVGLWEFIEPIFPKRHRCPNGGRPPLDFQTVADGIFIVLRTGIQWKAVSPEFGSGCSLHRYFLDWVNPGAFWKFCQKGLLEYDEAEGNQWDWQGIDVGNAKSPLGGEKNRNDPTDRSKKGTSRSLTTDGYGVPLEMITDESNVYDTKLFEATLSNFILEKPYGTHQLLSNKGYDSNLNRLLIMVPLLLSSLATRYWPPVGYLRL